MRDIRVTVSNEELDVLRRLRRKVGKRIAKNIHRAVPEDQVLYRILGDVERKGGEEK